MRIFLELLVFCAFLLVNALTKDIQYTAFGVSEKEFIENVLVYYIFIRTIVSFGMMVYKYRTKGIVIDVTGAKAKAYFENRLYGYLALISLEVVFLGFLKVAFLGLFLIFGILWLLSTITLFALENDRNQVVDIKTNEANENDENDFYNFVYLDFYSEEGFDFFKIITDNTFGILNNYYKENAIILLDKLSKSNYLFLMPRSLFFGNVDILCGVINSYLEKLDIKLKIQVDDIFSKDTKELIERRRLFLDTLFNDLRIIDELLKKKGYRVVSLGVNDSTDTYLCLSVVSKDVYRKLKEYFK